MAACDTGASPGTAPAPHAEMTTASIIIPTHNRPEFVDRAVGSALDQSVSDIEVIVVDDGSDPPCAIKSTDPRVRLHRRDSAGGPCAARNDGLALASGDYVTFLDDDDLLAPTMIEEALDTIRSSTLPAPVAALTGVRVVDGDGNELGVRHPPTLPAGGMWMLDHRFDGNRLTVNTLVAPRGVVDAIGRWDPQLNPWEHDDFFLRLNAVCSLQGVDLPLYEVTDHQGARGSGNLARSGAAIEATYSKHRSRFDAVPRSTRAHYLGTAGVYHLRAGSWRRALRCTAAALRLDPTQMRIWKWFGAALAGPRVLRALRPTHR